MGAEGVRMCYEAVYVSHVISQAKGQGFKSIEPI